MAIEPLGPADDLAEVLACARRRAAESGELLPPDSAPYVADVGEDVREFVLGILRDGSYAAAVAELAGRDPDLATQ
jgi:hypothetical protein